MASTRIVGIDCAVDTKNIGIAFAEWKRKSCTLTAVQRGDELGTKQSDLAHGIAETVGLDAPVVCALDAPLGWPAPLGRALFHHRAGGLIPTAPDELFRRATDHDVRKRLGKQPLDVGADRIARTALAALDLLRHLRAALGNDMVVATSLDEDASRRALEVYPAGTLKAHGLPHTKYKSSSARDVRGEILKGLKKHVAVGKASEKLLDDANCLDAAVCVLAALDYLRGEAGPPADPKLAVKEGWIWVRSETTS